MRTLAYALVVAAFAVTPSLQAQTMSDLQKLSDAVWDLSTASSPDEATFEQIVRGAFPTARFDGPPLHSKIRDMMAAQGIPQDRHPTGPQLPPAWDGIVQYHAAYFPDYSDLDGITCVVMTKDGTDRLLALKDAEDYYTLDSLPFDVRQFPIRFFDEAFENGAVTAQSCSGAFHPNEDRVDYDAWEQWYDGLEEKFLAADLQVEREAASPPAYLAGLLSAKGSVCDGQSCIVLAAPFNAALPSLNTNQATFTVGSVLYP